MDIACKLQVATQTANCMHACVGRSLKISSTGPSHHRVSLQFQSSPIDNWLSIMTKMNLGGETGQDFKKEKY